MWRLQHRNPSHLREFKLQITVLCSTYCGVLLFRCGYFFVSTDRISKLKYPDLTENIIFTSCFITPNPVTPDPKPPDLSPLTLSIVINPPDPYQWVRGVNNCRSEVLVVNTLASLSFVTRTILSVAIVPKPSPWTAGLGHDQPRDSALNSSSLTLQLVFSWRFNLSYCEFVPCGLFSMLYSSICLTFISPHFKHQL